MVQNTLPAYDLEEVANEMIARLDEWDDLWVGLIKIYKLALKGKPVSSVAHRCDPTR